MKNNTQTHAYIYIYIYICKILIFVFGMFFWGGIANAETIEVSSSSELTSAIGSAESGDTIMLTDNITSSTSFKIYVGMTIDLNEHTIYSTISSNNSNLFLVYTDEEITFKNGTIDGNGTKSTFLKSASVNDSQIILTDLIIQKFYSAASSSNYYSLIYVKNGSSLIIDNCQIVDNNNATTTNGIKALYSAGTENVTITNSTISDSIARNNTGGAFSINSASSVVIENNTIKDNLNKSNSGGAFAIVNSENIKINNNIITGNEISDSAYGGGISLGNISGEVEITNNTISNNVSPLYGGALYIVSSSCDLTIKGNTISGNTASGYGGGIYISNSASYSFGEVEITDNTISNNEVEAYNSSNSIGGGIYFSDKATSHTVTSNYDFSGNTIIYNSVDTTLGRGGGISLYGADSSRRFVINSGVISNNSAYAGGGIDFTLSSSSILHLYNIVIASNEAGYSGGGYWSSPQSTTTMYQTKGVALYNNTAGTSGDDIRFEGSDSTYTTGSGGKFVLLADRALGGTLIDWYSDEENSRKSSLVDYSDYQNIETSFGLYADLSSSGIELAEEAAELIVSNNYATAVGGGIASNSEIIFGEEDEETTEITLSLEWVDSNNKYSSRPSTVSVTLIRIDSNGNEEELETITLSEDNLWTWTFTNLPSNYTYSLTEETVDSYETTITGDDSGGYIVVNTYNTEEVTNPNTGMSVPYIMCTIVIICCFGLLIVTKRKKYL